MRTALYTGLVWLISQILWMVLLVSTVNWRGAGGLQGALIVGVVVLPPLALTIVFFRWWRRCIHLSKEAEQELTHRSVITQSGFQLVPASGLTPNEAIICLERNPTVIPAAEIEYLHEHLGLTSVKVVQQALMEHQGRMMDLIRVEVDGNQREFYFDVSRSAIFS